MKKSDKELLTRIFIWCAPVFTLIMFALPWSGLFKYTIGDYDPEMKYASFFKLFDASAPVISKILMGLALAGVATSIVCFALTFALKKQTKLLNKIGTITLVVTMALLILCPLFKKEGTLNYKEWLDFLTLPYGLALIYDAIAMGLIVSNSKKK